MKNSSAIVRLLAPPLALFCQAVLLAGSDVERQLDLFFDDPAFHRALWAVKVQSVHSGEILYEKNSEKYVMPASNMKLLTAVAAIEQLGLDFRYRTVVATDGSIRGGRLEGNLIVIGSGDPTLGARLSSPDPEDIEKGDPLAIFREWAGRLKEQGISYIDGDIIGDDSVFSDVPLGDGWAWDDLPYGYSAEVGGLQFNENNVLVELTPAPTSGGPIAARVLPETSYLTVVNQLRTVESFADWDYEVKREPGTNRVVLKGTLPAGHAPLWLSVSVDNPTTYFVTVLREALEAAGIGVSGRPRDRDDLGDLERPPDTLFVYQSPDMKYIVRVLLKISQNLYAETLVRTLDGRETEKSFAEGREEVRAVLTSIGIPSDAYVLTDGSGLSRYSLVTADLLVRLLRYVYRTPYKETFLECLPVAGLDGTIEGRFQGTAAQKNVRAKTGTLSNVRALSGYITTKKGNVLAFSMIVNNYTQTRRSAEYLQDLALEYLANLER